MNTMQRSAPWTNGSVLGLAGDKDPVQAMVSRARLVAIGAMDRGWSGPPFDPIKLAGLLGVQVIARDDVRDARIVTEDGRQFTIEFNPGRPANRLRYSIAHEIAHTLFEDCGDRIRHRAAYHELEGDEWQLEALCNIAAAELLMPVGSFPELGATEPDMDSLLQMRRVYGVSMEALLIRVTRVAEAPVAMFCASRVEDGRGRDQYRLDYAIEGDAWSSTMRRGMFLPPSTCVAECTAIGYTAQGVESWNAGEDWRVACMGIPPYPSAKWPRVVGLLRPTVGSTAQHVRVTHLRGDALDPRGSGPAVIAHVVNDATPNWGGRGFANAVKSRLPHVQEDFRRWARLHRTNFRLGQSRAFRVNPYTIVFSMICQEGYGPSAQPRLRYAPLQKCLIELAELANENGAAVHMPRIGAGLAGGDWEIIEELIEQEVVRRGIPVTVYSLPEPMGAPPRLKTAGPPA
jgi:O-acetyl-ADP-ribose deacetylase (regulator of RNase III)